MNWKVLSVLALVLVAGCAGSSQPESTGPQIIEIDMDEFSYTPGDVEIRGGEVTFIVSNSGVIGHEMRIYDLKHIEDLKTIHDQPHSEEGGHEGHSDGFSVAVIEDVQPGEVKEITVTIPKGTYEIGCHLPGHYDAGMLGTLNAV